MISSFPKILFLSVLSSVHADEVTCGQLKSVYQENGCCGGTPSASVSSSCPVFNSMNHVFRFGSVTSAGEIMKRAENDFVQVVDVRSELEYNFMGSFRHAVNCPVADMETHVPLESFLPCVFNKTIKNLPVVFACDSGTRALLALSSVQDSVFMFTSVQAIRPGGITQIKGYPIDEAYTEDGYVTSLFNNYVSTTTAIGLMASKWRYGNFSGLHLLDVRSSFEFVNRSYSISKNVPLLTNPTDPNSLNEDFVPTAMDMIEDMHDSDILIIYCASGTRARQALSLLHMEDPLIAKKMVFAVQNGGFEQLYVTDETGSEALSEFMVRTNYGGHAFYNVATADAKPLTDGFSLQQRTTYQTQIQGVMAVLASFFD